jgi:hypothetical protein
MTGFAGRIPDIADSARLLVIFSNLNFKNECG